MPTSVISCGNRLFWKKKKTNIKRITTFTKNFILPSYATNDIYWCREQRTTDHINWFIFTHYPSTSNTSNIWYSKFLFIMTHSVLMNKILQRFFPILTFEQSKVYELLFLIKFLSLLFFFLAQLHLLIFNSIPEHKKLYLISPNHVSFSNHRFQCLLINR